MDHTIKLAFSIGPILLVFSLVLISVYIKATTGICTSKRVLNGSVVIVTGANAGIGYETAQDLARRGAKVIMACRSIDKGQVALDQIKKETGSTNIFLKKLDLSSLTSVRKFAAEIIAEENRLDVLVNNAGAETMTKTLTEDGLETNFAANHFGPFLLTNLLLDLMVKTGKARIVIVSSLFHTFANDFDLENLNSEKYWNPDSVYSRTKLANVLFMKELHRRLELAGLLESVTVNALHPGMVKTSFLRYSDEVWSRRLFTAIWQLFWKTANEGAQTQIYLAVSEEVEGISGRYFSDCKEAKISKLASNAQLAVDLWKKSTKAVKMQEKESIVYNVM